jgi:putative Mn2+ efflux pump MntP
MDLVTIFIIGLGLSMDSLAVSICNGLSHDLKRGNMVWIALIMGLFQGGMPLVGWLAGTSVDQYIRDWDHWIAFIILAFIGFKMIWEGLQKSSEQKARELTLLTVIGQAIATSIDALAVGISFAFLNQKITIPIIIIGVMTFLFSFSGLQLGKLIGKRIGKTVEILGGIILIGIGIKILFEHLFLT